MDLVADEITELLRRSGAGDGEAAARLLDSIYADLRQIARARLRGERHDTLNTTALVHEAWLAMAHRQQVSFESRRHYFAYAAKAMRNILIDRVRQRFAEEIKPQLIADNLISHLIFAAIIAFCTCNRFSASSITTEAAESITPSVTITLRRTGKQCMKIALFVRDIFSSSTIHSWRR